VIRLRLLLAALSVLAVATGCATGERPSFVDDSGPTVSTGPLPTSGRQVASVAVVGDSITALSEVPLREALTAAGVGRIVIDAQPSRRIEVGNGVSEPLSGMRTISRMRAAGIEPEVWVIALGTNDVGSYPDAAAFDELIGQVLGLLPADAAVVWVDVYLPQRTGQVAVFNEALRARMVARGNSVVASWEQTVTTSAVDLISSDDIHPNAAGIDAFAATVVQALQRL
jgi:lysophospholipase L1-like esterase